MTRMTIGEGGATTRGDEKCQNLSRTSGLPGEGGLRNPDSYVLLCEREGDLKVPIFTGHPSWMVPKGFGVGKGETYFFKYLVG